MWRETHGPTMGWIHGKRWPGPRELGIGSETKKKPFWFRLRSVEREWQCRSPFETPLLLSLRERESGVQLLVHVRGQVRVQL